MARLMFSVFSDIRKFQEILILQIFNFIHVTGGREG